MPTTAPIPDGTTQPIPDGTTGPPTTGGGNETTATIPYATLRLAPLCEIYQYAPFQFFL